MKLLNMGCCAIKRQDANVRARWRAVIEEGLNPAPANMSATEEREPQ